MKFTIGLPITKTDFLEKTLDSIKSQVFKDYELIIRNNGKDKERKGKIKTLLSDFIHLPNVKYFESEEQLSMPSNFNKILEKAEGNYFVILSDDDTMESNFLSEFDNLTHKYPDIDIFHCRCRLINEKDTFTGMSELCPEWESQEDFVFHRIKESRLFFLSDFVAKTESFRKIGGFNTACSGWGLDELAWSKLATGNGIGYSPKILLNYRMSTGNFTSSKENLKFRFNDIQLMYRNFEEIINDTCNNQNSVYPVHFMHKLNKKRTQAQYDLLFNSYAYSSNIIDQLRLYLKNKDKFLATHAFKSVIRRQLEKLQHTKN